MNCCEFGVCKQGHGCPVRQTPATPAPTPATTALRLPTTTRDKNMTSIHWLIAAAIIVIAIALALVYYRAKWHQASQALDYRTIDYSTMEHEVAALQATVPDARPRHRAGQPATVYSYPPPNLVQVRAQAINAALRDLGRHTTTPNPYRTGSDAHTTWEDNYGRLLQVDQALQAKPPAPSAAAVHAPAKAEV